MALKRFSITELRHIIRESTRVNELSRILNIIDNEIAAGIHEYDGDATSTAAPQTYLPIQVSIIAEKIFDALPSFGIHVNNGTDDDDYIDDDNEDDFLQEDPLYDAIIGYVQVSFFKHLFRSDARYKNITHYRNKLAEEILNVAGDVDTTGDFTQMKQLADAIAPEILLWGEDEAYKIHTHPNQVTTEQISSDFRNRFKIDESVELHDEIVWTLERIVRFGFIRCVLDNRIDPYEDTTSEYSKSMYERYGVPMNENIYKSFIESDKWLHDFARWIVAHMNVEKNENER